MSQTFQVVLCVSCKTFQVQFVKKSSNKWVCKICCTKQSVQQVYQKGSGAECRVAVQQLNTARGIHTEDKLQEVYNKVAQEGEELDSSLPYGNEKSQYYVNSQVESLKNNYEKNGTLASAATETQGSTVTLEEKGGFYSVPPEQSKWKVFLDETEN